MRTNVLDHGFVELVWTNIPEGRTADSMICEAARLSYQQGTKSVSDDAKLIDYLMRHQHMSPFEMPHFTFNMKLPIFVARQMVRHRTANLNELSGRYSEMPEEFYVPGAGQVRAQSKTNKQGREGELSEDIIGSYQDRVMHQPEIQFEYYREFLEWGIARELARINLPLSTYTQWYWQMDLRNLLGFLKLRMDSHAQYEIRVYAEAVAELIKPLCPATWKSFTQHELEGVRLSRPEITALLDQISDEGLTKAALLVNEELGNSRAKEFIDKLNPILKKHQ